MKWIKNLFSKKKNASLNQDIGVKNEEAEKLIKTLRKPNFENRKHAIQSLGQLRYKRAVKPLIELLNDPDEDIRSSIALSLGAIGDLQAVEPLISSLNNDTSGAVRSYAAIALGQIGDKSAIKHLHKVAFKDEDADTRQDARTILVRNFSWLENKNRTNETKSYDNEKWNFSLSYPSDWREFNDPAMMGQWYVPISLGKIVPDGWLKCMIHVKPEEVLNSNTSAELITIDTDGKSSQQAKNVAEYINQAKKELQSSFPGFELISTEEIKIDNKPVAKIAYVRGDENKRIYEDYTTLFGVGNTFLFICEVPYSEMNNYKDVFESFINSFKIGNNTTAKTSSQTLSQKQARESVEVYNKGVAHYRRGKYKKAIKDFEKGISLEEFSLESTYALCLCQQQLGLPINIPESFKGDTSVAGSVSLGTNIACHIIAGGHKANIIEKGEHTEIEAMYGSTKYLIHVDEIMGQFMTNVWRIENNKEINIIDSNINPNPTEGDDYIHSITKAGTSLSLEFLPAEGL